MYRRYTTEQLKALSEEIGKEKKEKEFTFALEQSRYAAKAISEKYRRENGTGTVDVQGISGGDRTDLEKNGRNG